MAHGNEDFMKRTRGRRRHPNGGGNGGNHQQQHNNNPNRSFDSNGPDVKVRGSAAHIYEKYQQLARDATSSGDRILAENYLQHAEHYYRIVKAMQPTRVMTDINDEDNATDGNGSGEQNDQGQMQVQHQHQHQHQHQQPNMSYDQPTSSGLEVVNLQAVPGVAQPMIIEDAQPDALPAFLQKPVFSKPAKVEAAEGEASDASGDTPKGRRAPYQRPPRRRKFDGDTAAAQAAEVSAPPAE